MKVLFDTNVFISLETPGEVLPETLSDMVRIARELHYDICYHHAQIEDLMRDKDEQRKAAQLSRIKQYAPLQNPPIPTDADLMTLGWKQSSEHDKVDNILLFSLKRSAVSFLVTEDRGIHKKAAKSGLSDRVFFTEDFLAYLRNAQRTDVFASTGSYVSVEKKFLYELDVEDVFFDSLRQGYPGFNNWYHRKAEEDRQAWAILSGRVISALCIYKEERDEKVTTSGKILRGKSLKLCTLKVAELGKKYGERLLYVAFNYATDNKFDYVYIQVQEEKHGYLISLLTDFGFKIGRAHV